MQERRMTVFMVADGCKETPQRVRERAAALGIADRDDTYTAVEALLLMKGYESRAATSYRKRIKEALT